MTRSARRRLLIAGVLSLVVLLYVMHPRPIDEGFSGADRLLTTGVEVGLWAPAGHFLQPLGGDRVGPSPRHRTPEDAPDDLSHAWIFEAADDPIESRARFPLDAAPLLVRLRHAALRKYLVWDAPAGVLRLLSSGDISTRKLEDAAVWTWERVRPPPGRQVLAWGDRGILRPKAHPRASLVLPKATVEVTQATGSDELVLLDRWGRGPSADHARFGRASSSAGPVQAKLAIDGREDTYCAATWWQLELPPPGAGLERIVLRLAATPAPAFRILLRDRTGRVLVERAWKDAPASVEWPRLEALGRVASLRIEATDGVFALGQVQVIGAAAAATRKTNRTVYPLGAAGAVTALSDKIQWSGAFPRLRHTLTVAHHLRLESSAAADRLLLWEWAQEPHRRDVPGWRLWVHPLERTLEWSVHDARGPDAATPDRVHLRLRTRVEDMIGRDVHVAVALRLPVRADLGWHRIGTQNVVHLGQRLRYQITPQSPPLEDLPKLERVWDLARFRDLGPLTHRHRTVLYTLYVDGVAVTELPSDSALRPTGTWRLVGAAGAGTGGIRSLQITQRPVDPATAAHWAEEAGSSFSDDIREIRRLPARLPSSPAWWLGVWVMPSPAEGGQERRILAMDAAWPLERLADGPRGASLRWGPVQFTLPLGVWSWVVLRRGSGHAHVDVQGRQVAAVATAPGPQERLEVRASPATARVQMVGARFGARVPQQPDTWQLRSPHPAAQALAHLEADWAQAGCPGRWDWEREASRSGPWLDRLRREGREATRRAMAQALRRAQRYLRHASPRGEEAADRAAAEACYYPVPVSVWTLPRGAIHKARTAPKCLPGIGGGSLTAPSEKSSA